MWIFIQEIIAAVGWVAIQNDDDMTGIMRFARILITYRKGTVDAHQKGFAEMNPFV
jgi:hypothetical protein